MSGARPRGAYGIDAPWVPWLWVVIGVVYAVLGVCGAVLWGVSTWGTVLVLLIAAVFLAGAALYWHATLRGKFLVWQETLEACPAPARALDAGCGRGAVAIMTARRFPAARIDGVDLWRSVDQSGNGPDAAAANAAANGVAARIVFTTGDLTALPYPAGVFDLVTASLSIHNIRSAEGRARAVAEAWRVLAPGGRLVIVDISRVAEYAARLGALGADGVTVSRVGWRMWWSGPWMATRRLIAVKPAT